LKQEKEYGAKRFIAEFPSMPWTLSVRIQQTVAEDRHLTFWDDFTQAAVAIVCVEKFN